MPTAAQTGAVRGPLGRLARLARRPEALMALPALSLGAYWFGGEAGLLVAALVVPALVVLAGAVARRSDPPGPVAAGGAIGRAAFLERLDGALRVAADDGRATACLVLCLDDAAALRDHHGPGGWDRIEARCLDRVTASLRDTDTVARLEGGRWAVALGPSRSIDLETLIQIGARLQEAVEQPVSLDGLAIYVTASVGFCLPGRAPDPGAAGLLHAAEQALETARRAGPGAIRAFTAEIGRAEARNLHLRDAVSQALEGGQVVAFFQPQVSADSGAVTGFEALARWIDPERGTIPPADFLPAIAQNGLAARLGEVMRANAFRALLAWDRAGFDVPSVAVNFSTDELTDPRLPDRVAWELERYDLRPQRLTVEILETVAASTEDDIIVQNITHLARMGCGIDLDDFGTGHAAIGNIRRFQVRRLKIDRSFVRNLDRDRDQQAMVAGILSLAERLGLDTVGEGVETPGEHACLAQLGCGHIQGFALARPMPFEQTGDWLRAHAASLARRPALRLGRGMG